MDAIEDHNERAKKWRITIVRQFINEPEIFPGGYEEGPDINSAALLLFKERPMGKEISDKLLYWNDKFCIAVMFRLPWNLQRLSAWAFVTNVIRKRFSWETHLGFDVEVVLRHIGIIMPNEKIKKEALLSDEFVCDIIDVFGLPTSRLGPKEELTSEEVDLRERYNRQIGDDIL